MVNRLPRPRLEETAVDSIPRDEGRGYILLQTSNDRGRGLISRFTIYSMFRAILEFVQSQDCIAHSQNPDIAH